MRSSFTRRCEIGAVALVVAALSSPALVCGRDLPPTTIGVSLMQATSSIDNISARAAMDANDAVLDAAATLRLSIEALRQSGEGVLDKRPNDLSAAQSKALAGIQSGVAALRVAADEPADQARERIDEIRRITSGLSPLPEQPTLLRASPSVLVPSAASESVLALTGRRLSKADPRLLFGEVEVKRTRLTDEEALFALPADLLRGSDRTPLAYSGRLLLSVRNCRWLIRCKRALQTYTVGVVMLPTRLATVRVGFDRQKTQRIYVQTPAAEGAQAAASNDLLYRRRFEYSTDDLTVMSCTREAQAPHAAGYFIDTDTLSASVTTRSGETKWGIVDASTNGFSIDLCAQPQIDKMGKSLGSVAVEATWKEFRVGDVVSAREWLEPEGLSWGAEIKQALPVDTHTIEVELEYFDGSHASFTQTSQDRYVEMKWNAQTRQLVLTPHLRSSLADLD